MTTLTTELSEPFSKKVIRQLSKGGTSLDYVPVSEVIARLNSVLGVGGWGECDTEVWRDPSDPDWVVAKTTVWIFAADGTTKVSRVGYGGQKIKRTRAGEILDLGDEYKGAHSDAFKKACTKLGVALHLARDDEAIRHQEFEEAVRERSNSPIASDNVVEVIAAAIEALGDEEKEAIRTKWTASLLPSLKTSRKEFTEAHAELAAAWLGIKI